MNLVDAVNPYKAVNPYSGNWCDSISSFARLDRDKNYTIDWSLLLTGENFLEGQVNRLGFTFLSKPNPEDVTRLVYSVGSHGLDALRWEGETEEAVVERVKSLKKEVKERIAQAEEWLENGADGKLRLFFNSLEGKSKGRYCEFSRDDQKEKVIKMRTNLSKIRRFGDGFPDIIMQRRWHGDISKGLLDRVEQIFSEMDDIFIQEEQEEMVNLEELDILPGFSIVSGKRILTPYDGQKLNVIVGSREIDDSWREIVLTVVPIITSNTTHYALLQAWDKLNNRALNVVGLS